MSTTLALHRYRNSLFYRIGYLIVGAFFFSQSAFAQSCPGQRERGKPKIVGGNVAKIAHWPAQAALRLHNPKANHSIHLCGGTVIAPNWVVTAAHCFEDFRKPDRNGRYSLNLETYVAEFKGQGHLQVVVGAGNLGDIESGKIFEIDKIVRHDQYKSAPSGKDIALVKLKSRWPGPVATLSRSIFGDSLTARVWVAGFGDRKFKAPTKILPTTSGGKLAAGSSVLREVRLPVVERDTCARRYAKDTIGAGQICAGFAGGGKDSCQGDSGGPLVLYDENRCPYQVGVVSWGEGCADEKSYGVYTRISHFTNWIRQHVPDANFVDETGFPNTTNALAAKKATYVALSQLEEEMGAAKGRVQVKIRLKSGEYAAVGNQVKLGERYEFEVSSDLDGRLILIDIDAAGTVTQIYPNTFSQKMNEGRIKKNTLTKLPGPGYGFDWFRAVAPTGNSKLLALVAPETFPVKVLVADPKRLSKGFAPEKAPTGYFMNLLHQIFRAAGMRGFPTDHATNKEKWGYYVLDYKILN